MKYNSLSIEKKLEVQRAIQNERQKETNQYYDILVDSICDFLQSIDVDYRILLKEKQLFLSLDFYGENLKEHIINSLKSGRQGGLYKRLRDFILDLDYRLEDYEILEYLRDLLEGYFQDCTENYCSLSTIDIYLSKKTLR